MINYAGEWFEEQNGLLVPYQEILRQHLLAEAQELADEQDSSRLLHSEVTDATIEDYL